MRKLWLGLFVLISSATSIECLFAQTDQYKFRHINVQHVVTTIFKDSRGFVWIGTASGLNRFDGYNVKPIKVSPNDSSTYISNGVVRIFETPDGQLGVVTETGLLLYNSETEELQSGVSDFYKKYSLSKNLNNIIRDKVGVFWFVESSRIIRYSPETKSSIIFKKLAKDSASISTDSISDFSTDDQGNGWLVHRNGVVDKIAVKDGKGHVVKRIYSLYLFNQGKHCNYKLAVDKDRDLWFYTPGCWQGVYYYNSKKNSIQHFDINSKSVPLNSGFVSSIVADDEGVIWVATDPGGLNLIDKTNFKIQYVQHHDEDSRSLAQNTVTTLYKDNLGIVWSGTFKRGVSYYHKFIYKFDLYKHNALNSTSLPYGDINRFAEDNRGNLWIGTNGGGLIYFDRMNGKFKRYKNDPKNQNSLSGDVIVSLCFDSNNILWIGTYNHGLNKFDGKKFTRYIHNPLNKASLPSQNIWEIFEDSKKRLWIGTIEDGIALLDRKTDRFQSFKIGGTNTVQSGYISAITEDKKGNIWFGTGFGVDVLSFDSSKFTHFNVPSYPDISASNNVTDLKCDSKDRTWICTSDGLSLFDPKLKKFSLYKTKEVSENSIVSIQESLDGRLWLGTLNGILEIRFSEKDLSIASLKQYVESDGLQSLQFNENALYKTKSGELVFGGPYGFNILNSHKFNGRLPDANLVFTNLQLYQKPVVAGQLIDGVTVLKNSIVEATDITFPPGQKFFSLEFAALDYFNPEETQYMYLLEGLNSAWLPLDEQSHKITFNGLNPGSYTLKIKTVDNNGTLGKKVALLGITILPPFWKTKTAFLLYVLLLGALLFVIRRIIQQREQMKFAIEKERQEVQRTHELDLMKIKFFTNVSHEFRTPLTLIMTPVEGLIRKATDPIQKGQFELIHRNAKRLLNLVNQLLDFRKLEVQEIKFSPSEGDIIAFVKETVLSFSDLSEKKNIKLVFQTAIESIETFFDQDKLEKILFNLLSNAFKFTSEGGQINVELSVIDAVDFKQLQINVRDTGIGIPADKLDKIFDRFFQNDQPRNITNQGSGIGLSITKEFVKIHGGRVEVSSQLGEGSSFSVFLPLKEMLQRNSIGISSEHNESLDSVPRPIDSALIKVEQESSNEATKKKTLLLVEDNDDFRFYLKDNLNISYTIYEAHNGMEGWQLVLSVQPDLIVSDIMMPEMNGIDLCRKIKTDRRVSHIPVILLTARGDEEQRIEGFDNGAEEYIAKPFNFEILEARIRNLIQQREKSQKMFRKTLDVKASELQITSMDTKFIENAVKCVEKNISSPDFSVEDLGDDLGISRAYLYKKMLTITGKSPLEFIRTIRLQHAAQLLEKSQLSVREIAYKVGFNTPKYFTKYFKEEFNVLPSNYAASKRKEE